MDRKELPGNAEKCTSDLLSGLIKQQNELGSLGTSLIMLLLCTGIQPAFLDASDARFHTAPPDIQ